MNSDRNNVVSNRNAAVSISLLIVISLLVHLWGIRKDLPFVPDIDEITFVRAAVNMVSSGNLNPGWFGQPGATVIYPLALVIHAWNTLFNHGQLLKADPNAALRSDENDAIYYYLGRVIAITWNMGTLFLIFLIGRSLFGQKTGFLGAGLYITYRLSTGQSQLIRTDSVAIFFGMLALWLIIRVYSDPNYRNQVAAGIAIGLGIASRYFMGMLIPVYVAANLILLIQKRADKQKVVQILGGMIAGLAAIGISFIVINPFILFEIHTAVTNIKWEARVVHRGADGLSPIGNMAWYLTTVFPESMTWAQFVLALAGMALVIIKKHVKAILGVLYFIAFFAGICMQHLHWARWVVELLPMLALFAAFALSQATDELSRRFKWTAKQAAMALAFAVVIVSIKPALNLAKYNMSQAHYSTRVDMYHWVMENIPFGSSIANEWYTAPMLAKHYRNIEKNSLGERTLEEYRKDGFEYLLVGSQRFIMLMGNPMRYKRESDFYQELFSQGELVKKILPKPGQAGPEIRLYRIKRPETTGENKRKDG